MFRGRDKKVQFNIDSGQLYQSYLATQLVNTSNLIMFEVDCIIRGVPT